MILKKSTFIKDNMKYIILCVFLFLINFFLLRNMRIFNRYNLVGKYYYLLLFVSSIIEIIYSILLFRFMKKDKKYEKLFLLIIIPFGLLYIILIPPGRTPDEYSHIERAFEISEGHLISAKNEDNYGGNEVPIQLDTLMLRRGEDYKRLITNIKKEKSEHRNFIVFSNTSLYCFICYIPQVIGILLAKLFSFNYLIYAYFGRITNFIVWAFLVYHSIRLIPFLKRELMFIMLMPITIQEAISLAPDSLTIAACSFLIAYVLHLIHDRKNKLSLKEMVLLFAICLLVSFCKIVYIPLIFIILLIPYKLFNSKKEKVLFVSIVLLFCLIANIIWLKIACSYLIEFNKGVNSLHQVKYILTNPLSYIQVIINTLLIHNDILLNLFSYTLLDLSLNMIIYYVYASMLMFVSFIVANRSIKINISKVEKIVYIVILSTISLLIFTSLYVQWTPVRSPVIEGVQGRYFIPILILLPLTLLCNNNKSKKNVDNSHSLYFIIFLIFENVYALLLIFNNFI